MAWLSSLLGGLLAFIVGDLIRVRRRHVVDSMRRAGIADPERNASAMYRSLGRALFDLAFAPWLLRRVQIDPRAISLASERGAVIATAHTGSFDLVACAAARALSFTVVTKRLSIRFLDGIWQGWRSGRGVSLVAAGDAARAARRALASGGCVAMIFDQAPERERGTVLAPFLGQIARVDLAPALIAARARVPLLVVLARRTPDGDHRAELVLALEPPARPEARRAWAEAAMVAATAELDALVRRHPDQWLWMHRRWKDAPAAPAPSFGPSAVEMR